jgi:hypothetical protein
MRVIHSLALTVLLLAVASGTSMAQDKPAVVTPSVAVGPQYDTVHVYVAPDDMNRLADSLVATFGGSKSQQAALTVTPTPSTTTWQAVFTPAGTFSVFGFTTPIPYPFGVERTGYLVTDMDAAIQSAKANEADVVVAPFKDPLGLDAIVQWPGGVYMQLYWHTTAPNYANLDKVPENRVYVSPGRADAFVRAFVGFSLGKIVSDDRNASGIEVGRPKDTYRRVRIDSTMLFRIFRCRVQPASLDVIREPMGRLAWKEQADITALIWAFNSQCRDFGLASRSARLAVWEDRRARHRWTAPVSVRTRDDRL